MTSTIHVGRGDLTSTVFESRLEDLDLSLIPMNSVDVFVMSSPYYAAHGASQALALRIGETLRWALKHGGRAFHVFGQVAEDFERPYTFNRDTLHGANRTYNERAPDPIMRQEQTLFWIKSMSFSEDTPDSAVSTGPVSGHQTPLQGANMVNDAVEFIFQYSKPLPDTGRARPLDRLAERVAVPFADKGNLKRGTRGKNGDKRCRGTAIFIPYITIAGGTSKAHRHAFPDALADYLIRLSGVPKGSRVCDLFEGGASTRRAAEALGMNYVGVKWEADK